MEVPGVDSQTISGRREDDSRTRRKEIRGLNIMASERTILIVEDEHDLAELVSFNLQKEGYICHSVDNGLDALEKIRELKPHLVVLDRMLPELSGDDVIRRLRSENETKNLPVIMLTARAEETDELVGFSLGADDYITKPCSMKLLIARVEAILRRMSEDPSLPEDVLSLGPISVDLTRYAASVKGKPLTLTITEFRLLASLMEARGRVLTREQLIDSVLGTGVAVTDRTMDVHVAALRRKLGAEAGWVQTVRGVGYTFREPS